MFKELSIKRITPTQIKQVCDITVDVDHSYVGNGFVNHNCVNPNVQNITQPDRIKNPIAKSAATHVKKIFAVPKGYTWVQCDYSQLELRLIAWYSQCKYMLDAYDKDIDLHSLTAADVAGISLEEFFTWDKKKRKLARFQAKAVNFGWNYGQSPKGFQEYAKNNYGLEFTLAYCEELREIYFDKRPEILSYHDLYLAKANQFKYVRTRFGSKIHLEDIDSWEKFKVGSAERLAINAPIQGSGGQINTFAALQIQKYLNPSTRFILSVHDSNNYYIKNEYLDEEIGKIKYLSENLPIEEYFGVTFDSTDKKRGVKLKVDIETTTTTWKDLQELPKDYKYQNIF